MACVGLEVEDEAALLELVRGVSDEATGVGQVGPVDVWRWEDPSGARLTLELAGNELVGVVPSFAGAPGATLTDVAPLNEHVARATVVDGDGEQTTALAAEFELRRALPDVAAPSGPATVVALGVEVTVHASAAEYDASDASLMSQESATQDPPEGWVEGGLPWPQRFAAESFVSYGVFGDPAEAGSGARLAGTVLHAERRTVARTGQEFTIARVRTAGFEADVCLAASEHPAPPAPRSIISGLVVLVVSMPV